MKRTRTMQAMTLLGILVLGGCQAGQSSTPAARYRLGGGPIHQASLSAVETARGRAADLRVEFASTGSNNGTATAFPEGVATAGPLRGNGTMVSTWVRVADDAPTKTIVRVAVAGLYNTWVSHFRVSITDPPTPPALGDLQVADITATTPDADGRMWITATLNRANDTDRPLLVFLRYGGEDPQPFVLWRDAVMIPPNATSGVTDVKLYAGAPTPPLAGRLESRPDDDRTRTVASRLVKGPHARPITGGGPIHHARFVAPTVEPGGTATLHLVFEQPGTTPFTSFETSDQSVFENWDDIVASGSSTFEPIDFQVSDDAAPGIVTVTATNLDSTMTSSFRIVDSTTIYTRTLDSLESARAGDRHTITATLNQDADADTLVRLRWTPGSERCFEEWTDAIVVQQGERTGTTTVKLRDGARHPVTVIGRLGRSRDATELQR